MGGHAGHLVEDGAGTAADHVPALVGADGAEGASAEAAPMGGDRKSHLLQSRDGLISMDRMDPAVRDLMETQVVERERDGAWFVRSGSKVLGAWVNAAVAHEEKATLSRRKAELYVAMSADGRGYTKHRVNKYGNTKAIRLNVTDEEAARMRGAKQVAEVLEG